MILTSKGKFERIFTGVEERDKKVERSEVFQYFLRFNSCVGSGGQKEKKQKTNNKQNLKLLLKTLIPYRQQEC